MKVLNLVYPDKSEIRFKKTIFPDGQQNITIEVHNSTFNVKNIQTWMPPGFYHELTAEVEIKSRLNNFQDLELIICATKALRKLGVTHIHLYTPYFLGSRSDRQFEEGSTNYLKDVIAPIINSLKFDSVTVLDPHSSSLECCLNNFKSIDNLSLVKFALNDIYNLVCGETGYIKQDNFVLISSDAGASKKIYKLAEQIGYKGDIITCSKVRGVDGKLNNTIVPLDYTSVNKDFIVIDDICDGGATFINIAKVIKGSKPHRDSKLYLIVTHGIFSKGFDELIKYFDGIYCTNSYKDAPDFKGENLRPINLLKQLNVF